jgi:hypothetical protein
MFAGLVVAQDGIDDDDELRITAVTRSNKLRQRRAIPAATTCHRSVTQLAPAS